MDDCLILSLKYSGIPDAPGSFADHSYTDITNLYPGACQLVFRVVAYAHTMFS